MSKTPICDKWEYDTNQGGLVVPLNVAKDLETELAKARAKIESLTRSLTIVANWENVKRTYTADEVKEFARGILDVATLEAAERGE